MSWTFSEVFAFNSGKLWDEANDYLQTGTFCKLVLKEYEKEKGDFPYKLQFLIGKSPGCEALSSLQNLGDVVTVWASVHIR